MKMIFALMMSMLIASPTFAAGESNVKSHDGIYSIDPPAPKLVYFVSYAVYSKGVECYIGNAVITMPHPISSGAHLDDVRQSIRQEAPASCKKDVNIRFITRMPI